MNNFELAVIIPTHNRCELLQNTLRALEKQDYPLQQVQVIVVANGCVDGTVATLSSYGGPLALTLIDLPAVGPAAARNAGAEVAQARVFIFLDDDIEALPGFLAAHAGVHTGSEERVAIGYLPTYLTRQKGYFRTELRGWWENMFSPMHLPGYRFRYTDLLTGNFSIPSELFRRLGGFDPSYKVHEDYEFGLGLLKAGVQFQFAPQAAGYHHEHTVLAQTLTRKVDEGQVDVQLARKHPEILPTLQLVRLNGWGKAYWRAFFRLAFDLPVLGDFLAVTIRIGLNIFEWMRMTKRWRGWLEKLLVYWYLRGVAKSLGSHAAWVVFVRSSLEQQGWQPREITINLDDGVEAAERLLDEQRPDGITVCYHGKQIGVVESYPGMEPLRGVHLRPRLADDLAKPLFLAAAGDEFDSSSLQGRLMARIYERIVGEGL